MNADLVPTPFAQSARATDDSLRHWTFRTAAIAVAVVLSTWVVVRGRGVAAPPAPMVGVAQPGASAPPLLPPYPVHPAPGDRPVDQGGSACDGAGNAIDCSDGMGALCEGISSCDCSGCDCSGVDCGGVDCSCQTSPSPEAASSCPSGMSPQRTPRGPASTVLRILGLMTPLLVLGAFRVRVLRRRPDE